MKLKMLAPVLLIAALAVLPGQGADARPVVNDEWSQIIDRLEDLDGQIAQAEAEVAEAEAKIAAAETEVERLDVLIADIGEAITEAEAEVDAIKVLISERAVIVFTGQPSALGSLDPDEFWDAATREVVADSLNRSDSEIIEELDARTADVRALNRTLKSQRAAQNAVIAEASAAKDMVEDGLSALRKSRQQAQAEADKLGRKFAVHTGPIGSGSLCMASGIQVHCSIASPVNQMVAAARADGVALSGGGYRDASSQIALRKSNCGGEDHWSVYGKPASACSPATARPGSSMHERGLAIDFHNCSSTGSECHQWMLRNGATYGFYNLPGEPWHWSTTGS